MENSDVPGRAYWTRMLGLLNVVARSGRPLTMAEIADEMELARPTVHRMLSTLTGVQLVRRTEQRTYEVGSALLRLSAVMLPRLGIRQICRPYLERLSHETGESTVLAVPVDDTYMHLDRVESRLDVRQTVELGTRFPLVRGAGGIAILIGLPVDEAEEIVLRSNFSWPVPGTRELNAPLVLHDLEQARARGYAWSEGECSTHSFSVAAPVLGWQGRPVASISIAGPRWRFNMSCAAGAIKLLTDAVKELSVTTVGIREDFNERATR